MSGAEAVFVVGIISGVISIIEATKALYDVAKDAKGQPEAFRRVAARLPLVIEILHRAEKSTHKLNGTAQEALKTILESCKAKAEDLKKVFQKVIRKEDDEWYDRYTKAVGLLGKEIRVEYLMEGILKDVQVLICERLVGIATQGQEKEIEGAIQQMADMSSSLQDEAGNAGDFYKSSLEGTLSRKRKFAGLMTQDRPPRGGIVLSATSTKGIA
jgi:vacuolar-type H+-ATPase subunit E/Vma4